MTLVATVLCPVAVHVPGEPGSDSPTAESSSLQCPFSYLLAIQLPETQGLPLITIFS